MDVASVILAAGRGTRMIGYGGCKALLPLIPFDKSPYEGERPFIVEILEQLPPGPKAVVIHHDGERVQDTLSRYFSPDLHLVFIWQSVLNGTGGALLSAESFLRSLQAPLYLVTMADVPLISRPTYDSLMGRVLEKSSIAGAVLAFRPKDKAQYGRLITKDEKVIGIVEWKYWKDFDAEKQRDLGLCNAGVYAFRPDVLLRYLPELSKRPHVVQKTVNGKLTTFEEFFLPDVIALMAQDGLDIAFQEADEDEVLGVDTPEQLEKAQALYKKRMNRNDLFQKW